MKNAILPLLTLSLVLASCGSAPTTEQSTQPTTTVGRLILSEQPGTTLFALKDGGFSDYKLHVSVSGSEKVSTIANGTSSMVLGAALTPDSKLAYVALRETVDGNSHDRVVLYDVAQDRALGTVSDLFAQNLSGTVYNSLSLQGNKLRFVAEQPKGQEEPTPSDYELTLGCGQQACGNAQEMQATDAAAYKKLLEQKLAPPRAAMSAQAAALNLNWPKGVSGHHAPGSSYHTGRDTWSLDINRGSGEMDFGDPVRAAASGRVIEVIYSQTIGNYGNRVRIQHPNGAVTLYAHLNTITVGQGSSVSSTQNIGTVGHSGLDLSQPGVAAHLHFTLYNTAGNGVVIANGYYPMYARVGSGSAACVAITTDMRDGREYFPC